MDFVRDFVDLNLYLDSVPCCGDPRILPLIEGLAEGNLFNNSGAVEELPTSLEEAFEYGGAQMQNLFRKIKVFEDGFEQGRPRQTGENEGERPRLIH